MQASDVVDSIKTVLDEKKGQNIRVLDVIGKTSVTDYMVLVNSTSARHAKSLCDYILDNMKQQNITPLGVEGLQGSDWVLVDLGDVIVHIMTSQAEAFYQLEKLWSVERTEEIIE